MKHCLAGLLIVIVIAGCGGDSSTQTAPTTPTKQTPTVGLAASANSLNVVQDVSDSVALTVTRGGGFTGSVALSVDGAPTGVAATLSPDTLDGATTTAWLRLAVSPTGPPGNYSLLVHAAGSGVATQTISVSLTVAVPKDNVTFQFCSTALPVFVASQDGSGPWTAVSGDASGKYRFTITSKGAVAIVTASGTRFATRVAYGTRVELQQEGLAACSVPAGTINVSGSVAGIGTNENATVGIGQGFATPNANGPISVASVPIGTHDLVAANSVSGATAAKKIIIRRGFNATAGATIPLLDFGSSEAVAPATGIVTFANGGSDLVGVLPYYYTSNSASRMFLQTGFTSSTAATKTYTGVPASLQVPGDIHGLVAIAQTLVGTSIVASRSITTFFAAVADKTITFGPSASPATVNVVATSPTPLLSVQWAAQSQYGQFFSTSFSQTGGNQIAIVATATYVGDVTSIVVTMPNLSSIPGWNNAYGLVAGTPVQWSALSQAANFHVDGVTALGTTALSPPQTPTLGGTIQAASRGGVITP